ncbi:lysylphosphatidylglycerol synthase domain-containing protein [Hylemonella gracilis]|uniref:Uncharacterized protein n=1 Tax=Hylemonella gracilis ATCC 19624 TaxID=887062 RepID=F3KSD5_9BURK|nr:lysylphosphatidylglycerol synthase domain-containing protein [Hylemonella gracilis]EGI77329.1 hypothetical protein HGR_06821 [Hylemonella gracilis ATCC 19624]
MKRALKIVGYLLTVACIVFLGRQFVNGFHALPPLEWNARLVLIACFVVGLGVLTQFFGAVILKVLLIGGQVNLQLRDAFVLYGRSSIAKYLPGNIFHYVGRIVLGKAYGIAPQAMAVCSILEVLLAIAAAALVTAPGVFLDWQLLAALGLDFSPKWLALGLACAISIILAGILHPRTRSWMGAQHAYLSPKRLAFAFVLNVADYIMLGISLYLLQFLFVSEGAFLSWASLTWGFALAWAIGFVMPGAPGGVGVREFIAFALFAPSIGGASAASLFLGLRILNIAGELVTFAIATGTAMLQRKEKRTHDSTNPV